MKAIKTRRACYIFILICVFTNCKKTGLNYVRGIVYEFGTGIPLGDAKIYFYREKLVKSYGYDSSIPIDNTTTDVSGNYKMDFSKVLFSKYHIRVTKEGYYDAYSDDLKHGRTALTTDLIPVSYVRLRFVKATNSAASVRGNIHSLAFEEFYSPSATQFGSSGSYDSTVTGKTYRILGYKPNEIRWQIFDTLNTSFRLPTAFDHLAEIVVSKFDTLTYTIKF